MTPGTFAIDLDAPDYLTVLKWFHTLLQPSNYFEIGTRTGDSLKIATCPSVCVDPAFSISSDVIGPKPACHFYQTTSDAYFARHAKLDVFAEPIQLAYLDGMHLAEFLLRDFLNVEARAQPNSVVIMHDCIPSDIYMTCRNEGDDASRSQSNYKGWWTGDVWKTVWALQKFRPDLSIVAIDSPPTGLICVTNLNPADRTIQNGYKAVVTEMLALEDTDDNLQRYIAELKPIKPAELQTFDRISQYFYL